MTPLPFTHPLLLWPAAALALLTLALGLRAQLAPGRGVRTVGQRPLLQGASRRLGGDQLAEPLSRLRLEAEKEAPAAIAEPEPEDEGAKTA